MGGSDHPHNIVELTPCQHAMWHFASWQRIGDYREFCAYKMILGDVKNPEFRSARAKAFSHIFVEKARAAGVYDYEMSHDRGVKGNKAQRDKFKELNRTIAEKQWVVQKVGGEEELVTNLAKYCREHNLSKSKMCLVAQGKRKTHKGYVMVKRA